jgi:hypothetical protein
MKPFTEQLASVRANLARLQSLFAAHPDLFECAMGIYIYEDKAKVYIHATSSPSLDWLAFARRYRQAGWKREHGGMNGGYNYSGTLDGVELCIIGAEQREEPVALEFAV